MSSCFSRCLGVPIAIRAFYESYLWILETLLLTHPDFHPGLLGAFFTIGTIRERSSETTDTSTLLPVRGARQPGHHLRHQRAVRRDRRIEVKAPKGKLRDSQVEFQKNLEAAGGKYILAYSLDKVISALR